MAGSYEALEAGNTGDALVDFTGGVCESINLKDGGYSQDTEKRQGLFKSMERAMREKSLISASIRVCSLLACANKMYISQVYRVPAPGVWEVIGSIPVGDSDFFLVARLCHVDQFTFHILLLVIRTVCTAVWVNYCSWIIGYWPISRTGLLINTQKKGLKTRPISNLLDITNFDIERNCY